jgi:hypothetical protein
VVFIVNLDANLGVKLCFLCYTGCPDRKQTQLHQKINDRCMNYVPPVLPARVWHNESFCDFVALSMSNFWNTVSLTFFNMWAANNLQFNTDDLYCGTPYKKEIFNRKCLRNFWILLLVVHFLRNQQDVVLTYLLHETESFLRS